MGHRVQRRALATRALRSQARAAAPHWREELAELQAGLAARLRLFGFLVWFRLGFGLVSASIWLLAFFG